VRVLIAEDDVASRSLLGRILTRWGYEVTSTADGVEAWRELQGRDPPRLAIVDWMMPGLDGVELCRRVREADATRPPYIILLTAREGKHDVVIGLDAGANDYVGKPFDRDELHARLEVGRRFIELNEKLLETQQALESLARTDALTGTMNRRAILERVHHEAVRAEREGHSLGLGVVDIDHFKRVNDTYGHGVGDHILQVLVSRALAAMRPYDGLGRLGGEEFLAVLPHTTSTQIRGVLERMRRAICESPVEVEDHHIEVTVSIGGAVHRGGSVESVIQSADEALYKAKSQGRNCVVMAEPLPGDAVPVEPTRGLG
jgi:two-component system cell cycle response regulator